MAKTTMTLTHEAMQQVRQVKVDLGNRTGRAVTLQDTVIRLVRLWDEVTRDADGYGGLAKTMLDRALDG